MMNFRSFFAGLSARARWAFALGVVAILAVTGAGSWWALHPAYAPLAHDLRPADAAEIGAALSQWGVPYHFEDGDKTLLVPEENVYPMRMKLASEGIPKGGSIGFEAFKDSDYGVTEFAQRVNYQRALQGELERTIESMQEVRSARVHLTIHHAGLFDQDQGASKASVTLTLRDATPLAPRQIAGIQRLVASAVEGLAPSAVTLLDQSGAVLSGAGDDMSVGALGERMDEATKVQEALRRQAAELLARALHRKDFTVSVAVQLNYDRIKRVGNRLLSQGRDGNGLLVREKSDSNRASGQGAISGAGTNTSGREVEYAHGTVQEEVEQAPGRIERITVGIVLPVDLSPSQASKLKDVVAAGIGLDPSRGDRVDLVAMSASATTPTALAASRLEQRNIGAQDLPVAKPAPVVAKPLTSHSATFAMALTSPVAVIGVGTFAACMLFLLVYLAVRRPRPVRLTLQEREVALARIRQWIEAPEHRA